MYYDVIVYSTTDGNDEIEVIIPEDYPEDQVDQYIEDNYPTVVEYQVEPNY